MIAFPYHMALWSWLWLVPVMAGLWAIQRIVRNAVIADIGFCLGFGATAIGYGLLAPGDPLRRVLVASMAVIYAARLGLHLFLHRVYGKEEDPRYRALRHAWGEHAQRNFFVYFQAQALAVAVFSLPVLAAMTDPQPPFKRLWDLLGVGLWIIAVIGETIADVQLQRFRTDPRHRGRTCRVGLWRYSRHPNYFFESLHWWVYVAMGLGTPYWWITLIGPALMTWALLKVSGIPFAEARALANRGADYRDYQRTTSAFIPWFPKRK